MGFAERNGFAPEKTIQIEDMDRNLRNRLYNAVHKFLEPSPFINDELKYVVDKLGYRVESTSQKIGTGLILFYKEQFRIFHGICHMKL